MALKIVTGGTTGAADGTLVSSSNKITFSALDTVVDCHIRADDDTYSADATFTMPSDGAVQVSFDGGSTWKAFANNPASYGVDIGDLNVAIKLRQHANATASTGTFQTDATTPAATALGDVTGFSAAAASSTTISLSWTAVSNRTAYRIDRATDSGFTTGVALDISPGQTTTSFTDTGLTNGTTYYYRIKAVGTVRYKDSANYATGNGAPVVSLYRGDTFADSDGVAITSRSPLGPVTSGSWTQVYDGGSVNGGALRTHSGRVNATVTSDAGSPLTVESWLSGTSNNDCAAEVDVYVETATSVGNSVMVACRVTGTFASRNELRVRIADDGTLNLDKFVAGTFTNLGSYAVGTLTVGSTYTLRVEAIGSAIKAYVNGVQRISVTDTGVTAGGGLAMFVSSQSAQLASSPQSGLTAAEVRLYNT